MLANRYEYRAPPVPITENVWLATDTHTNEPVVVKQLRGQQAIQLEHRNIVRVIEIFSDYVVLEYIDGRTLRDVLSSEGPMKPTRAIEIITDICDALEFANRHGVHTGIGFGSSDVMLDRSGAVKVLNLRPTKHMNYKPAISDVHKAGKLFVELLTGTYPHSFGQLPPGVPWRLRGIARKIAHGASSQRYQTFDEFKRALLR